MNIMIMAAILFGLAAAGGVTMAYIRLSDRELPPGWLAVLHGLIAAAGLIALAIAALGPDAPNWARVALGIFVIAALGGFGLASFHLRRKALPVSFVAVHGVVAVIGFVVLLVAIFTRV